MNSWRHEQTAALVISTGVWEVKMPWHFRARAVGLRKSARLRRVGKLASASTTSSRDQGIKIGSFSTLWGPENGVGIDGIVHYVASITQHQVHFSFVPAIVLSRVNGSSGACLLAFVALSLEP